MAPKLTRRLKVLRNLEKKPHRYPRIRRFTMALTLGVLYAVPLLGLARFDLWDGRHMWAGARAGFVFGFGGVFLAIVAFYLATFIVNAIVGRLFCGFGCPVGQLSRMGDSVEIARRTGEKRLRAESEAILYSAGLAGAGWLWFVDPRVFVEGTPRAAAIATLGLVGLTGALYAMGRFVSWRFCQGWCPIGIYYSVVRTAHGFGVHFDEASKACTDCGVCEQACPVGLDPRDLEKPLVEVRGLAIEDLPQANHCLTCGECVRGCEDVFSRKTGIIPPLALSRRAGARGADRRASDPERAEDDSAAA